MTYARSLSSMTGGQGSFTLEFSHYEIVPPNEQAKIVAAAAKSLHHVEEMIALSSMRLDMSGCATGSAGAVQLVVARSHDRSTAGDRRSHAKDASCQVGRP